MERKTVKYNPAFLTDEELIGGFSVRIREFELITEIVRENTDQSNQHVLITGPRGSGKTTLVRRIAAEVRRHEELKIKWYPIIFSEESYLVQTPGEFWLEAIFHLGEQTKDERWQKLYEELKKESSEERLREMALARLLDFADEQDKRLLLVVENLHMLLGDQISDADAWVLRKTLLHEPRVMMLGTSVGPFWTGRFVEVESEGKAMFELFKRFELPPLSDEESKQLWESVTGETVSAEQMRPINILTGGNARLIGIISKFGKGMSFENLMQDFVRLVDENTEYFKSHLDGLAPTERKVYLALAEIWDETTARIIAGYSRLGVNQVSAILNRLEEKGAITVIKQGRRKSYQISERMYNIYHLMRRRGEPTNRVKFLVRFMTAFYPPKKRISIMQKIAEEACEMNIDNRQVHCVMFKELLDSIEDKYLKLDMIGNLPEKFATFPEVSTQLYALQKEIDSIEGIDDVLEDLVEGSKKNDHVVLKKAESDLNRLVAKYSKNETLHFYLSAIYLALEKWKEADRELDSIIEINPNSAWCWQKKAYINHYKIHNYEEAKKAYLRAIAFDPMDQEVWLSYAMLLSNRLNDYKLSEQALLKSIDLNGDDLDAYVGLACIYQCEKREPQKIIDICLRGIEKDDGNHILWCVLASAYLKSSMYEECESACRKSIEINPTFGPSHGLLCVLFLINNRVSDLLIEYCKFLDSNENVELEIILMITTHLVAKGHIFEVLESVEKSLNRDQLEPLYVGLCLYLGREVKTAEEIRKVGEDIAAKIREAVKEEKKKEIT